MRRLAAVVGRHVGDDSLPRQPQYGQHLRMTRARIVIERFDPPIAFAADRSGRAQDDRGDLLPPTCRLDRANEAVPAVAVPQPALAPLLLGRQQAFDPRELGESGALA
jgi:hypothetical protein